LTAIARARLLGRLDRHAEAARVLEKIGNDRALPGLVRRRLAFARGDTLDRLGRYEEALAAYAEGNALNPAPWDPEGLATDAFGGPDPLADALDTDPAGAGVVLIVGMPRSGTTLVEQILAAHPAVIAGGERDALGRIAAGVAAGRSATLAELQRTYRADPVPAGHVFTDKMPLNFLHLDLAAALLPGARVIHCRRDARDTALSCYFTDFIDPALAFARRWDWLAGFTRGYQDRMARWRGAPRLTTLDVDYEGLVADPETVVRGLLEFLDLQWTPACLAFHRIGRIAGTASHAQVRRPVYASSVGRWRHYETWLPGEILEL
jgi:tetratricopeptide (TPR) repeat protein